MSVRTSFSWAGHCDRCDTNGSSMDAGKSGCLRRGIRFRRHWNAPSCWSRLGIWPQMGCHKFVRLHWSAVHWCIPSLLVCHSNICSSCAKERNQLNHIAMPILSMKWSSFDADACIPLILIVITYAEHFCLLANELLTRGSGHCLFLFGQSANSMSWHFLVLLSNKKPAGHSIYVALPRTQLMYLEHEFGKRNAVLPTVGHDKLHFTCCGKSHDDFASLNKYPPVHFPGWAVPLLHPI